MMGVESSMGGNVRVHDIRKTRGNTYNPEGRELRPGRETFLCDSIDGQREFTVDNICMPHIFKGRLSKCVQSTAME